jgi:hypothetical protein
VEDFRSMLHEVERPAMPKTPKLAKIAKTPSSVKKPVAKKPTNV